MKPFLTFFPQFCREPINDVAWYSGYTDWDLIREVPEPHRTRFTPAAGYYDLADRQVIARQFAAVRQSQWPAMALYQYYFDGRFALDSVERYITETQDYVPPFFVIWANESWSKRWIGRPHDIIIRQEHRTDPAVIHKHVERLTALFRHPSYERVNGRPIFVIYAAFDIPQVSAFINTYRRAFAEAGFDPLIGFCVSYVDPQFDASAFDFCVEFQPRLFFNVLRSRRHGAGAKAALFVKRTAPWVFDCITGARDSVRRKRVQPGTYFSYQDYLELVDQDYFSKILEHTFQKPAYKSLFYSWNNFPRYRGSAVAVNHRQGDYEAFERLCNRQQATQKWFLVNSWNEWSEGAALEPGVLPPRAYDLSP